MVDVGPALARELWHRLEVVNAVTYFSPECRDAATRLGLRGFWMGTRGRAAPMGSVGAGVVEATFFNFHPERVRRAIPDAWDRRGSGHRRGTESGGIDSAPADPDRRTC